jgi:adenosine deaminase
MRTLRLSRTAITLSVGLCLGLVTTMSVPASRSASDTTSDSATARRQRVSRYLDSVRDEPDRLAAFLADMPKGGDLHVHLSGAISTEALVRFAVANGDCVDTRTLTASAAPCGAGQRPATDTATDPDFYNQVIRAWSMKAFVAGGGPESGHDHFFATFDKFGAAADGHRAEMLAEVVARAAAQQEFYLEPLVTLQFPAVQALATEVGYDPDFDAMRNRLFEHGGMERIVRAAQSDAGAMVQQSRALLGCGTAEADPGCDLALRLDHQVLRAMAPEVVFAEMVLGFELMDRDPLYVGINLVQPEDDPVARRDYGLHMRMLDYLRGRYHREHITLHAGELTPGLAPPADLRFHIRDAVLRGGAERIGHGVDVAGEDDSAGLLRTMAERHVAVEIALTSNSQILGVSGEAHPFALYRRSGVPVTLVTDDEGVSRTDLAVEYQEAVTAYRLRYADLKTLARAAVDHGFLQGASLWPAPDDYSRPGPACAGDRPGDSARHLRAACRALLRSSPKAAAEWRQEAAFARFERRYGG